MMKIIDQDKERYYLTGKLRRMAIANLNVKTVRFYLIFEDQEKITIHMDTESAKALEDELAKRLESGIPL